MKENNPVTVAEETKRLEENPISPPTAPVVTATEQSAVPTTTVTATHNVPTAPIVENVAKEEVSVGGTPPAPVTPVPTPATPTDYKWDAATNTYKEVQKATETTPQTTQTTPTEAKVPSTDKVPGTDKTQAEFDKFVGREKEVLTNLNEAYASGIKDGDGIRKFASYDTATPEKKAAIDAFILSKRKEEESASNGSQFGSEDGIYGALVNNVMVPPSVKNSPAYKSAEARYKKYKFLTSASTDTLKELLKNGKLVPGTKTYNDFYNTPTGKANIDKANKLLSISGGSVDTGKAGTNMTGEVLAGNTTLAKALEDGEISVEELNSITSSPELIAKGKELAAKKLEIDKLNITKKKIRDDVDKEYGGGLTSSEKASLISNRSRDIDRSLDTLILEYNSEFGQYSQEKEQKLALFNTNLALYKEAKKAEVDKLAKIEERKYEDEKEKSKRIYDSVNAQIKFALENGVDLKRTDANAIIADAQRYADANGVSLAQAINETFTSPLTAKPSYARALQAIYDKNSGAITPFQKEQLAKMDKEYKLSELKFELEKEKVKSEIGKPDWVQDKETGEWVNKNSLYKPGVTVGENGQPFSVANYSTSRNGSTSVTCGQLTNDYIADVTGGTFTKRMGDSIESKEAVIDELGESPTPVVGGLFTFRTNTPYGHTGIVSAVNQDGSIVVREANRAQRPDGKSPAETHTYSADFVKEKMKFSVAPSTAAFYKDEYVNDIVKSMGGFSKTSDAEVKRIESQAKGYIKEGLSPRQSALRIAGLKIKDPSNEDLALDLFEKSRNLSDKDMRDNFGSTISTFINSGDTEGALNFFEKQVDADVKKTYDKEAILSSQRLETKKWNNEIVSLINSNRKDIGLVNGTIAEWKQKFAANPNLKRLNTILTKIQADERKYFAGSAVTATELDALRDFIGGTTKMNADDLIMQINTLEEMNDSEFRSQRAPYGY